MRTFQRLVVTACLALALASSLQAQDRIPWVTDLRTARQMAEQQQRLVLLHFWSESCAPCQRLEHSVFNQPELIRAMSTAYVPVKINTQQSPDLANFYKVTAIPTDIVVDPTGKEVYRASSPQDMNAYVAMLDGIKAHHSIGQPVSTSSFATTPRSATSPWQTPAGVGPFAPAGAPAPPAFASAAPSGLPNASSLPAPADSSLAAGGQSAFVENPYSNPLYRETPPQPVNSYASRYGNPSDAGNAPAAPRGALPAAPRGQPAIPGAGLPLNAGNAPVAGDCFAGANPSLPPGRPETAISASQYNNAVIDAALPRGLTNEPGAITTPNRSTSFAGQPGYPQGEQRAGNANPPQGRPWDNATAWNSGAPGVDPRQGARSTPTNPAPAWAANPALPTQPNSAGPAGPPSAAPNPGPPGQPPLAMDGFCPVNLVEHSKWTKGDPQWGAVHRGRVYLFSSINARQQFLANPERFSPVLSGHDAVRYAETGQLVEGKREHGVYYRDRILLFADEDALQRFGSRPEYYVAAAEQVGTRPPAGGPPRQ